MKKLLVISVFCFISVSAFARARIPYCSDCEYMKFVAELPDDSLFAVPDYNAHLDIGYKYKQFWLVWVPIWNYDGQYCLMIKDKDDVFFEAKPEEIKAYQEKYKLDLPENPLPFWDKLGGKLIVGLLVALGIYGIIPSKDKKEEMAAPAEENKE